MLFAVLLLLKVRAGMEERASLLIVDDERGPAESLRMIFKPSYNVYTASGGQQALEILQSTPIDVVTLDLRMPAMSGVEVMERIKAYDSDVEVIVVTGYSSLDSAIKGLRHGVFDYISKPFDVPQICDLVRRAVARRRSNLRHRRIKEDFLANLSHELRTPLSAIIGYSAILAEELHPVVNSDQRTALERIQINSIELLNLVEGVLLLNALDAGEIALNIRPFNLGETVARAVEKFQPVANEKGLVLRTELATSALSAISDEEKVERVFWALLDNAVKFTAAGTVSVAARRAPQPGALEIEVSDTGIGMQREEIVQALEGLSQADASARRRFRGLGLGLRIATRLIELLGGDLRVRSEASQGTHFIVTIPARAAIQTPHLH
jgi:signal transduction histidine kinase